MKKRFLIVYDFGYVSEKRVIDYVVVLAEDRREAIKDFRKQHTIAHNIIAVRLYNDKKYL